MATQNFKGAIAMAQQDFAYRVSWPSRFGPALRAFSSADAFEGYVAELQRLGCPAKPVSVCQVQTYLSQLHSSQSCAAAPARSEARTAAAHQLLTSST